MNLNDLLNKRFACACGSEHAVPALHRPALRHMHEIRRRFTVVDLAWMLGILPDAAQETLDHWLTE